MKKNLPARVILLCGLFVFNSFSQAEPPSFLDLETTIGRALEKNPAIAAAKLKSDAEHTAIRSQYSLSDPMIGLEYEKNFTLLETLHGPMRVASISQEIQFPLKYFRLASIQKNRAEQAVIAVSAQKLEVRQKAITAYYRTFTQGKILSLLKANLETARKTARTAELRHSTGLAPQQDEMKAHVEETRIHTEILLAEEAYQTALAELTSLLQEDFTPKELPIPRLDLAVSEIPALAKNNARSIQTAQLQRQEAELQKSLASMNYLPDFKFSYRQAFGNEMMSQARAFGVEFTFPLWFALKQSVEHSNAATLEVQSEHQITQSLLETHSKVRGLAIKAKNHETLLQIHQTALIPQATATLNSSQAAYRAGKIGLLELLDSQRALDQTQIAFYQTLAEYTEVISELETTTGASVSNLPFPPETL